MSLNEAVLSYNYKSIFKKELQKIYSNISLIHSMLQWQDQLNHEVNGSIKYLWTNNNSTNIMVAELERYVAERSSHIYIVNNCSSIGSWRMTYSSGYYLLLSSIGVLKSVYCDLTRTFGGNATGWTRVAELEVNNCPPGMRTETVSGNSTCVVSEDAAGCTQIVYSTFQIEYTHISGKIRGYLLNTMDGFDDNGGIRSDFPNNKLYSNYLDGVSVTSNGIHVWSFVAGCDCMSDKPKWFYKEIPPTTADISVRICRDQGRSDEDLALTELELYIQ